MNILTFDIEEWFHILDNDSTKTEKQWTNYEYRLEANMNRIFELLDRKKQKATFFCLGWVAREFPQIIKKIEQNGFEIATHSDLHQLAYQQSKEEFKQDLNRSIKSIEDLVGKKVKIYRAPGFSIKEDNTWVFEELIKQGINIDCSVFPAKRSHGGLKDYSYSKPSVIEMNGMKIKEFPINLYKIANINFIFSGGGYFRILPYWMIKKMMEESEYVMTYFHPRDFDINQPIIHELSFSRKFKSYIGLKSSFKKLDKLLADFNFMDISTANNKIDWNNAREIKL